jgi:hypothetical protein
VKLLWAVTQPDGLNRYKQGILDAEKDWAQKMTKRTGPSPVWDAMLAEQRVHSPNPMPANNMLQLMTDVYASDLYTELTAEQKKTRAEKDYQFFIGTLHRILHCDQTFLQIGLWRDDEANAFLGDFKFLLYVPTFFICRAAGIVRGWKTRGLEFLPEEFKNTSQGGAE